MASGDVAHANAQLGVTFMVAGAVLAVFDVLFAGCIASGPCQPVLPYPIVIPLAVYAFGAALALLSIWRPRSRTK